MEPAVEEEEGEVIIGTTDVSACSVSLGGAKPSQSFQDFQHRPLQEPSVVTYDSG